jgi:H+/Cl- antiporter ClcA
MASSSSTRNASPVVTAILVALGIVLAIVGVIYLVDTATHLPSFFPGHQAGSTHHHTKHALLAFVLALLAFIGAWMSVGKKTPN